MRYRNFFLLCILSTGLLIADPSISLDTSNEEEALFLRRVVEFYQENEICVVKKEIHKYLINHKEGRFIDHLLVILGDIYMEEKDFKRALASYSNIKNDKLKSDIVINVIQCLYEMERYKDVISQAISYLKNNQTIDEDLKNKIVFILGDSFYQIAESIKEDGDQQERYLKRAVASFKNLLTTSYKNESLQYLAQIYQLLDKRESAADTFLKLSEFKEESKEQYLYQAAVLFSKDNPNKAVEILDEIIKMKHEKTSLAAFLQMKLLFSSERYLDLISSKNHYLKLIDSKKAHYVYFYVGKSYFLTKEYEKAKEELSDFVQLENIASDELRCSLLTLIKISFDRSDKALFDKSFSKFSLYFSNDIEMPQILFSKALLHKRHNENEDAYTQLEKIEKKYNYFEKKKELLFEASHLLLLMNKAEESRESFKSYINLYPEDIRCENAWEFLVEASILRVNQASDKEAAKKDLSLDITSFLQHKKEISDKQKEELLFILASTEYDLKNYEKASMILKDILKQFPEHPNICQVYIELAYCYREKDKNYEEFCSNLEKAFSYPIEKQEKKQLYLALYNCYLKIYNEKNNDSDLKKAADNLYLAHSLGEEFSSENFFWLVEYYYSKVMEFLNSDFKNSIFDNSEISKMGMKVIDLMNVYEYQKIDEKEFLILEKYILYLSDLYELFERYDNQYRTLQILEDAYNTLDLAWSFKDRTYYNLANFFEMKGNRPLAESYYKMINNLEKKSYYSIASTLKIARLSIENLSKEEKNINNQKASDILGQLKYIRLQKKLENEPLHLEAAMDYVDFRTDLEDNEKAIEKKLYLLEGIKKDFFASDIQTKEYHNKRKLLLEKDNVFQAYIKMIDIEIYLCNCILVSYDKEHNKQKLLDQVRSMLNSFAESKLIVTPYLQKRWEKNVNFLEELENEVISIGE